MIGYDVICCCFHGMFRPKTPLLIKCRFFNYDKFVAEKNTTEKTEGKKHEK
jgi:hypothetical protein